MIVTDKAGLRGFVVIRRNAELTGSAEPLCLTGVFDGAARIVRTCADDDGNGISHTFQADFNDAFAFIHCKGARFAGCAQQHQRIHLRFQLHGDQAA